jgi:hypothetical protein
VSATVLFRVEINISDIKTRVFDIHEACDAGAAELHSSDDEDACTKDLVLKWPCEVIPKVSFARWMTKYAAPMLAQGAKLFIGVRDDGVRVDISQTHRSEDPVAWVTLDTDKLTAEAGAKLAEIKTILERP